MKDEIVMVGDKVEPRPGIFKKITFSNADVDGLVRIDMQITDISDNYVYITRDEIAKVIEFLSNQL